MTETTPHPYPYKHRMHPAVGSAGLAVRTARLDNGLTLAQLADRIGSTKSILSKIERGAATPNVRTLERIADALDADLLIMFEVR